MNKLARAAVAVSTLAIFITRASTVLAGVSATESAGKGGTSGALPSAGSTELTYAIFIGGVVLFVFGMLKLVFSYRE